MLPDWAVYMEVWRNNNNNNKQSMLVHISESQTCANYIQHSGWMEMNPPVCVEQCKKGAYQDLVRIQWRAMSLWSVWPSKTQPSSPEAPQLSTIAND